MEKMALTNNGSHTLSLDRIDKVEISIPENGSRGERLQEGFSVEM